MPDASVDLVVTSPPYGMQKEYEKGETLHDFKVAHERLIPHIVRLLKDGGSVCWQVGYHVRKGELTPLDFLVYDIFTNNSALKLRNRIMWHFGHGLHCRNRFSGRHETILWFTKGDDYHFDLDAVRVPQKYPGKRNYKGPNRGEYSGNPLGKNPADVWDIPNVKSKHVEKTDHPCQYPVALVQRLVKSLCPAGGTILDPFAGSCSTGVAALMEGRKFVGAEMLPEYADIGEGRLKRAQLGIEPTRALDKPIYSPDTNQSVARAPKHFH